MTELARILAALAQHPGQPAALATLVHVEGSSYRRPGARLLLLGNGVRIGSISGGCLEEDILERARRVLSTGRPETAQYDTTSENDLVWGVGLGCQGVVRIFLEKIPAERPAWVETLRANLRFRRPTTLEVVCDGPEPPGTRLPGLSPSPDGSNIFYELVAVPPSLLICGAGDDAQPLVRLAKEIGWYVTVTDSRAAQVNAVRFPAADAIVCSPADRILHLLSADNSDYVVVMTHRYAEDLQLLRALLLRPLPYLGVLGPRKRTDRLIAQLSTEGLAVDAALAKLHAPIGLDLGGSTPETVALSIMAELQIRLSGRAPAHLRDRNAPIHG